MYKNMKKIVCIALFAATAVFALAQQFDSESDFMAEMADDGSARITEYIGSRQTVRVPSSIQEIPVAIIGAGAFKRNYRVNSVILPNSVTRIEEEAFAHCTGLTRINIPNGVISIGISAFKDCRINNLVIPNSVKNIDKAAFADCHRLTGVIMGNSITRIENEVFMKCYSLTSITIPNSVTAIGWGAFSSCTSLRSITIPDSVTDIEGGAFAYCTGLTGVTIPAGVTSIGDWAFRDCTNLTSVTFQGTIAPDNFGSDIPFPGDLREKYLARGAGTYRKSRNGNKWTKQ